MSKRIKAFKGLAKLIALLLLALWCMGGIATVFLMFPEVLIATDAFINDPTNSANAKMAVGFVPIWSLLTPLTFLMVMFYMVMKWGDKAIDRFFDKMTAPQTKAGEIVETKARP